MATQFAAIVGAMVTALGTPTAVSGQIYRARMRPLAAQHTNAVVVRLLGSTAEPNAIQGAPFDWLTQITTECYARSTTTSPDQAADNLWAAVYARLMADTTLAGLVADLRCTQLAYDYDQDADATVCITATWQASHRSSAGAIA